MEDCSTWDKEIVESMSGEPSVKQLSPTKNESRRRGCGAKFWVIA